MNSKKLIEEKDYKFFPYNYKMIEYVKVDTTTKKQEETEKEKNKIKSIKILFHKPISRVQ